MSRSEVEHTIAVLSNDEQINAIEISYIGICLFPPNDFIDEIVRLKGSEWLEVRLERKLNLWVPYALTCLQKEYTFAIDANIELICIAADRFESIKAIVQLKRLAKLRQKAHIRAGKEAVEYLSTGGVQMQQPYRGVLASALLAKVNPSDMGDPSDELCTDVIEEVLPQHGRDLKIWYEKFNAIFAPFLK